ncbi:hypothetical protein AYI70_g2304 [Smittium culicis]|uniref:Uncharacterized protein n=1 Tax=Smittium culicis TaxID=133412 RepID=A0A1R1Y8U2_9FUNG|nr:hypothetical protein AYI70_g2304 [Smittium culicis]
MIFNLKIDCLNIGTELGYKDLTLDYINDALTDENSDDDEFYEDLLYNNENYLSSNDEKNDEIQSDINFISRLGKGINIIEKGLAIFDQFDDNKLRLETNNSKIRRDLHPYYDIINCSKKKPKHNVKFL